MSTLAGALAAAVDKEWFARTAYAMRVLGSGVWIGTGDEWSLLRPLINHNNPDRATLKRWARADYEGG